MPTRGEVRDAPANVAHGQPAERVRPRGVPARRRDWRRRRRVGIALPCAIGFLALASPSWPAIAIGATIAAVGLLIRAVAAGQLKKHEALTTTGMYGVVRHPLYLGSAVLGVGFLIAGRSWPASLFVVAYALAFYPAIIRHEEERLRARYGQAFAEHEAHTPMLRPRFSAIGSANAGFSWRTYRRNREYRAAAGAAVGFLVLTLRLSAVPSPRPPEPRTRPSHGSVRTTRQVPSTSSSGRYAIAAGSAAT
jgi:uncharacterized membrane protein